MHSGSVRSRRTGRTKAGPAQQFPLPDSSPPLCESCLASNQVSTKSRCLTITPRFTVICRDTDFRPNLRHLCLTRWIVSEDTHTSGICLEFIRIRCEFWKIFLVYTVCTSKGKISLWISFHRSSRSSGSIGALKMWHRLNEISKFRADETSSKRFFPPPLGRGKAEKHSLVFLEIDFFGENERKEHRDGGIIFLSAVHVESRRSFGESGGGTRTRRSVTFLFIRSSRRRLPGPDNEWMSKTQQLIQPRGEQRRKNTVVVVVVLERSSSSTRDPTKEEGVCKWGEPASRGKKKGDNWQWGSNGREGTMVGSSNFTLLIVIQFHGASGCLCLLVSLSLSPPLPRRCRTRLCHSCPTRGPVISLSLPDSV